MQWPRRARRRRAAAAGAWRRRALSGSWGWWSEREERRGGAGRRQHTVVHVDRNCAHLEESKSGGSGPRRSRWAPGSGCARTLRPPHSRGIGDGEEPVGSRQGHAAVAMTHPSSRTARAARAGRIAGASAAQAGGMERQGSPAPPAPRAWGVWSHLTTAAIAKNSPTTTPPIDTANATYATRSPLAFFLFMRSCLVKACAHSSIRAL